MKRSDRIASKVDAKKIRDKGARVKKIDRSKPQEWPTCGLCGQTLDEDGFHEDGFCPEYDEDEEEDTYVDGNGRTQRLNHCARCGDDLTDVPDSEKFLTVAGNLVCDGCADDTV